MIIERGRNIPADGNKKTAINKALDSAGVGDRDRPVLDCCRTSTCSHPRHLTGNAWSSHIGYNSSRIRQTALELGVQASASDL
jgi:hypothetical protein